jgi:hypothetical protein
MSNQPIDIITLVKYAVGALLIIAGVALIFVGQPDKGIAIIAVGIALIGVGAATLSGTYMYTRGFKAAVRSPV